MPICTPGGMTCPSTIRGLSALDGVDVSCCRQSVPRDDGAILRAPSITARRYAQDLSFFPVRISAPEEKVVRTSAASRS
jgi:hypothetical protein